MQGHTEILFQKGAPDRPATSYQRQPGPGELQTRRQGRTHPAQRGLGFALTSRSARQRSGFSAIKGLLLAVGWKRWNCAQ